MRAVAVFCFFLSGASGLIFEVIWTRMFSLVFGATTLAISTVLTAFMGGLALGSYLAGRLADRIRDPLKAYALAEAGVGVTALLLPLVVGAFGPLNQLLYRHFQDNYAVLAGMRFLVSAAVMVVPTSLMGATLPLLSRLFVQTQAEHARMGLRVGTLYSINTCGAIVGTFLGGFCFLPELGLAWTNGVAACTNLSLALVVGVAYLIRRRLPAAPAPDPELAKLLQEVEEPLTPEVHISRRARLAALAAFACSGGGAMVYQVIWTRALAMNIGSSVYSFTLVLTAFLIGLAAGAALVARLAARTRSPVGWLAANHLLITALAAGSYLLLDKLPFVFLFLLRGEALESSSVLWMQFLIALLIMLPATLAMGGIFPLTIRICASGLDRVGQDVGSAYSVNTLGSIAGSFLAGFVVIPVLQLQPGYTGALWINCLLAATLAALSGGPRRWRAAGVATAAALIVATLLLPRWNLAHLSAGLFRMSIARDVIKTGRWQDPQLVFYRDGISTTVSVEQWSKDHLSLKNNGKVDASTGDDMPTQITVGLLPILVHPRAPDVAAKVALIGLASGVTAGAILQYPVSRLDVVELEPAVARASVYFERWSHSPLKDRRLRLIMDDGRNFLQAGSDTYDVIINEPSNPWITGVSNLFTREYFETGRRRLAEDGIFCTWAQMYEIAPRHIKSIYRTFSEVFPYVYAFSAEALSSDTFLIGSLKPLKLDLRRLRRAFAIPSLAREMERAKVHRPDDLVALTLLGPGEVHAFAAGAEVNTDDNALIEFGAPRDLYNHKRYDYYVSRVYGQNWLYGRIGQLLEGYRGSEDYAELVRSLLMNGKHREASAIESRVQEHAGPRSALVRQLLQLLESHEVTDDEVPITLDGPPLTPPAMKTPLKPAEANRVAREYAEVERRTAARAYRAALDLVEAWPESFREEACPDFQLLWGYLAYKSLDFSAAASILQPLLADKGFAERRPALLYYAGRVLYGNADFAEAISLLERWITHRVSRGAAPIPTFSPATLPSGIMLDVRPGSPDAESTEGDDRP